MKNLIQPLQDEHKELMPHIERILDVVESIPEAPLDTIREGVNEVFEFLAYHLVPHAQAEDAVLYPAVQRALGSPDATRTMTRDHVEVGRYIDELSLLKDAVSAQNFKALQRVLYGVYALVKVHFAKEEEVYVPILQNWLTPEQAADMFEKMEEAARSSKSTLHAH